MLSFISTGCWSRSWAKNSRHLAAVKPALSDLAARIRSAWSAKTASIWTADVPARGQCSVTALVVQDLLGGAILKTRVGSAWHFYNRIEGERVDLTESQFAAPVDYQDLPSDRSEAFADTTAEQYEALRGALFDGEPDELGRAVTPVPDSASLPTRSAGPPLPRALPPTDARLGRPTPAGRPDCLPWLLSRA